MTNEVDAKISHAVNGVLRSALAIARRFNETSTVDKLELRSCREELDLLRSLTEPSTRGPQLRLVRPRGT